MFVLGLVLVMGAAALVIDVGFLRTDTARLQNALDAGALAAAQSLPTDGTKVSSVTATAQAFVHNNYPSVAAASVNVSYQCLISSTGPTAGVYSPNTGDAVNNCAGFTTGLGSWTCSTATCYAPCVPATGVSCNMIAVTATDTQPYTFGRVFGLPVGVKGISSGTVNGGGTGGGNPVSYAANFPQVTPVDVVVIVDRTQSMSGADTTNARAAASSIVSIYDPTKQWLAFGLLGPSNPTTACSSPNSAAAATPDGSIGTANPANAATASDLGRWIPVGLSGQGAPTPTTTYKQASKQDYSAVTAAINCYTNSSTGTDLADPLVMAQYTLDHYGSASHRWGIILETDGQPNTATSTRGVTGSNYCAAANTAASYAKTDTIVGDALHNLAGSASHAGGIEIYTIGFGLDGNAGTTDNPLCPDTTGAFHGQSARQLLASVANSSVDNGCPYTSVTSPAGNHFLCVLKTGNGGLATDLTNVFKTAASSLASGSHLIQLPVPPPVITGIAPGHGSLTTTTTVTISGHYFSTAFAITGASSFTVNSDTSVTAVMPAHAAGTVQVTLTNPGGTSNQSPVTYP